MIRYASIRQLSIRSSSLSLSLSLIALMVLIGLSPGCTSPEGDTIREKQDYTLAMRDRTLEKIEAEHPGVIEQAHAAPGYAVFSDVVMHIIFPAGGDGYGVVTNNQSGELTFMRMIRGGAGLGLGAKSTRTLIIFENDWTLKDFVVNEWDFTAGAEAAAKGGDAGGAVDVNYNFERSITVYELTDAGLMAGARLTGTRFYVDSDLDGDRDAPARRERTITADPSPETQPAEPTPDRAVAPY